MAVCACDGDDDADDWWHDRLGPVGWRLSTMSRCADDAAVWAAESRAARRKAQNWSDLSSWRLGGWFAFSADPAANGEHPIWRILSFFLLRHFHMVITKAGVSVEFKWFRNVCITSGVIQFHFPNTLISFDLHIARSTECKTQRQHKRWSLS